MRAADPLCVQGEDSVRLLKDSSFPLIFVSCFHLFSLFPSISIPLLSPLCW